MKSIKEFKDAVRYINEKFNSFKNNSKQELNVNPKNNLFLKNTIDIPPRVFNKVSYDGKNDFFQFYRKDTW